MAKIKVGDINLYYEIHGKGEPIIFIAGFSADHNVWRNLIEFFSKNYQMIIFDNRGIGQSDCPDIPYTINMMADDVINLCKALNISSAYFVGNSMGGMILQAVAYRHPEFVKAAVLENSNTKTDIRFATFSKGQYELMKNNAPLESLIKISLPWAFSSTFLKRDGMIEFLTQLNLQNPYPMSLLGYQHQRHAIDHFNSREWVSKINAPCLVISGDKDIIFDETEIRELANLIPGAEYYCIKNTGHLPHIEKQEEFCEVVNNYLNKLPKKHFDKHGDNKNNHKRDDAF